MATSSSSLGSSSLGSNSLGLSLLVGLLGGVIGGVGSHYALRDPELTSRADRAVVAPDAAVLKELQNLRAEFSAFRARQSEASVQSPSSVKKGAALEGELIPDDAPGEARPLAAGQTFNPVTFAVSLRTSEFDIRRSDRLVTDLSINKAQIGPTIAALKKELERDPNNPELWSALGAAHTAKLASGQAEGPAAASVYREVVQAYDKAIQYDENHWTARYSKALTTSMAPEFVGLRPASIRMFEDVVQRQEAQPNAPEFARSYIRLGTLYKDAGNAAKAKEIWKQGLRRYPDDSQLTQALAVAEKK